MSEQPTEPTPHRKPMSKTEKRIFIVFGFGVGILLLMFILLVTDFRLR